MTIETALPTHLEAKTALDSLISTFSDSRLLGETEIKTATLGIANSLQIRDYALGAIGLSFDAVDSLDFVKALEVLGEVSPCLLAIKASYYYENDDSIGANLALNKALSLNPAHSLSLLLRRVMSAGWPSNSFASMRNELHPKVVEGLKELEEVAVNETR
jgi:hypothetical protein